MQAPRNFTVAIDEVELSVNEWAGDSDPILLLHATGFHSRCWDQVVKGLPGQHVYAVDIHLHGGSSMGGHLITRICAALPDRFKQLVLIDPVIFPPEFYTDSAPALEESRVEDHPVSRRKNNWLDAQEMFLRFKDRPPFDSWQEEVLQDYCDYALLPADEEGFRQLACNPINEASIYLIHVGNEVILAMLPHIATPVTLLRAPPDENFVGDFSKSPTWPELANYLPCCREFYLPDHTHFIPPGSPT
jgi:pimeloyl-ACP methyl ester carboxylesterase